MSPRRTPVVVFVLAALAATLTVPVAPLPRAGAIDHDRGRPGFCPDARGVTVVVDFGELGGKPIVRCHPTRTAGTGLDALVGAGFQIDGVQRWGSGFVCRIEGRPAADERIPIAGNPSYREACIDTPPSSAYWSYWHAGNNCAWTYSQWGVKNREFTPGGFEGWSFSLNATADDNPAPRIAPVRPGTEGGRCGAHDEPSPGGDDPGERRPGRSTSSTSGSSAGDRRGSATGGTDGGDAPAGSRSTDRAGVAPRPDGSGPADRSAHRTGERSARRSRGRDDTPGDRSSTTGGGATSDDPDLARGGRTPAAETSYTGGADAPDIRSGSGSGSAVTSWIALGGIVVLGGAAGWVEGRRRRRRAA